MELLKKEQINKARKDQTREIMLKNERLVKSTRKLLDLQNDLEFDADKSKKVKEYQQWCQDLQTKMSRELKTFEAYKKLTEDKKDEYYRVIENLDKLEDIITDKKEEIGRLDLQLALKGELLRK